MGRGLRGMNCLLRREKGAARVSVNEKKRRRDAWERWDRWKRKGRTYTHGCGGGETGWEGEVMLFLSRRRSSGR